MAALKLEIITPERVLVRDEVDMIEAQGVSGEFGILPGHTRFLALLDIGEIRYMKDGKTTRLASSGGFSEVVDDRVTFLLDTGEYAEEIDVERAKRALERAQTRLRELSLETGDYRLQEMALLRAIARISVAQRKV